MSFPGQERDELVGSPLFQASKWGYRVGRIRRRVQSRFDNIHPDGVEVEGSPARTIKPSLDRDMTPFKPVLGLSVAVKMPMPPVVQCPSECRYISPLGQGEQLGFVLAVLFC